MNCWQTHSKRKVIPPEKLSETVAHLRLEGGTVATLNGSFDLLHAGHLYMLYEAAQVADILLVALNTDASIKSYKGPDRPIVPLEQRVEMMTALECVDFVTWFAETDPRALLETVKPDVHVNGEEYGDNCIEAEVVKRNGGRLHLVPRLPGFSTSLLLERC